MNRNELIDKYKQTSQPMGIFQIRNTVNGKLFLGSAKDLRGIINSNRFQLRNGLHRNKKLQQDFNEIGEKGFAFEIVDYLHPGDAAGGDYTAELKTLEALWLEKLQPHGERGYNTRPR